MHSVDFQCKKMYVLWLVSISSLTWSVQTAHIFAILPHTFKSHFAPFESLLKRLAEKGHVVDFATHYPSNGGLPRYNELSLVGSVPRVESNLSVRYFEGFRTYDTIKFITGPAGVEACRKVLDRVVRNLKEYDLVVTEIFGSDCFLGLGAPVVSIVPMTDLPWADDRIGNVDNPSYVPNWFGFSKSKLSFVERVKNTVMWVFTRFLYWYFSSRRTNQLVREFLGPGVTPVEAVNTSLVLVNTHFSVFDYVRPAVPNFLEVGGIQIQLSKFPDQLMHTDTKGIIYLSMGSVLMTETFDFDKLQAMFHAFGSLPYKVLWKADPTRFPEGLTAPPNIHFEKWMPQADILCHPNTKLFVTHCGLYGAQEASFCGVPRLGIPFFADQDSNCQTFESMGVAIKVAYENITKVSILEAATKLLRSKKNVDRVARIFRDRPLSPLDTAVYWVEYVLKYKGAPHLRRTGLHLAWYEYYLVDLGVVFGAVLGFTYILCNIIYKYV